MDRKFRVTLDPGLLVFPFLHNRSRFHYRWYQNWQSTWGLQDPLDSQLRAHIVYHKEGSVSPLRASLLRRPGAGQVPSGGRGYCICMRVSIA